MITFPSSIRGVLIGPVYPASASSQFPSVDCVEVQPRTPLPHIFLLFFESVFVDSVMPLPFPGFES